MEETAGADRERARISMSYHCVSLNDVYWVRKRGENITFAELNLYDNPLNEAIVALSLKGCQMTVTNHELAPDLSTKGCFLKAWIRTEEGGNCQTVFPRRMTQREAAIEAVRAVGLCQRQEIDRKAFGEWKTEVQMFEKRLHELKKIVEI